METTRGVYNAFQLKLWEVRKELRVLGFNFGIEFSASNAAKGRLPVTPEEFERLGLSDDQQGCALLLQSEEAAWCYRTKMQHLLDAGQVIAITRLLQLQVVSIHIIMTHVQSAAGSNCGDGSSRMAWARTAQLIKGAFSRLRSEQSQGAEKRKARNRRAPALTLKEVRDMLTMKWDRNKKGKDF